MILQKYSNPISSRVRNQGAGEIIARRENVKRIITLLFVLALAAVGFAVAKNPTVGGQEMFPSKNIIQNAMNSTDHTTLVAAVKAAGLVDTLQSAGPFTVFAPVSNAFDALPAGTVDTSVKPENKGMLTKVLTYHAISGTYTSKDIAKAIKKGNGKA